MIVRSFCPGGTVESSPPFQGWGSSEDVLSPEGTAESLPQIPLVVLDLVFLQQRDKLLLKTDLPVMHFRVPEVRDDFVQLRQPGSSLPGCRNCKMIRFQEEFVALLKKHQVEYDERHLWE